MGQEEEILKFVEKTMESHKGEFKEGIDKAVDNILTHGMLPKEALAVDDDTVVEMCTKAYRLYNNGKYKEAIYLFSSLALLDPSEPKYIFGLAACNHMMGEYEVAAETYAKCAVFTPEDPMPYYHSAECCLELHLVAPAMIALQMAVTRAGEKTEYAQMKERAILMMDRLAKEAKVS